MLVCPLRFVLSSDLFLSGHFCADNLAASSIIKILNATFPLSSFRETLIFLLDVMMRMMMIVWAETKSKEWSMYHVTPHDNYTVITIMMAIRWGWCSECHFVFSTMIELVATFIEETRRKKSNSCRRKDCNCESRPWKKIRVSALCVSDWIFFCFAMT